MAVMAFGAPSLLRKRRTARREQFALPIAKRGRRELLAWGTTSGAVPPVK
jgi:hypothetical protein